MPRIYLDYNASTPIALEVAEAMAPFLRDHFGNPSSLHWAGVPAKEAIEKARQQVAALINCSPAEIVFTSGGSEANNYALKGIYFKNKTRGNHIITTQIEHPAVINPCRWLESLGAEVSYLPVDKYGLVDPDQVRRAITSRTILISIMHANNETGSLQPIGEIGQIACDHDVTFHTDAAQSVGKVPLDVKELKVDLLSIAGHKLYAPKGIGALYISQGGQLEPLVHGAGHESGRRAGTENVLLIVGLGKACEISLSWIKNPAILGLRDYFWSQLKENLAGRVILNGHPQLRLPNTLNVSFPGLVGAEILGQLEGVAASTGSACHAGSIELSPVLKAMGVEPFSGMGAVRFSLGRYTTREEIDYVIGRLRGIIV
ncbi:MAG: cysteine desulfurase [Candidatus Tectomicrobia bacterium]|uniref:cysteine desulfurase n=1 Tax=Tectimicrobiota bacterium TaxID=2528274 RepID=A0A933GM32_UNCTE|nr:cysteine desulfurase [Candidatus Tectomicrobia bacterium]